MAATISQDSTYIQNGIRTGVVQAQGPYGFDVNLSPDYIYTINPLADGNMQIGSIVAPTFVALSQLCTTSRALNIPLTLNPANVQMNVSTSPVGNVPIITFDCLRAVAFNFNQTLTAGNGVALVTGYDDRNVLTTCRVQFPTATTAVQMVYTTKAFMSVQSVVFTTLPTVGAPTTLQVSVGMSNTIFGLPYYVSQQSYVGSANFRSANIPNNSFVVLPPSQIARGFAFYGAAPNATASLGFKDTSSLFAQIAANTPAAIDARGLIQTTVTNTNPAYQANSAATLVVGFYVYGSDIEMLKKLNSPNALLQKQTQRQVSLLAYNATNPYTSPTVLSNFDVFGAQYPGDKTAYNQFFTAANQGTSPHPMV